jgi:hypothetical protein
LLSSEHAIQPSLGPFPIALDSHWRHSQDLCRFLNAQSAEVTELHNAGFTRIDLGQQLERFIEASTSIPRACAPSSFIEGHVLRMPALLAIPAGARMIHQNSLDDL